MTTYRFGLKKLPELGQVKVGLKSKFGLKPKVGCEIDFDIKASKDILDLNDRIEVKTRITEVGGFILKVYRSIGEGEEVPIMGVFVIIFDPEGETGDEILVSGVTDVNGEVVFENLDIYISYYTWFYTGEGFWIGDWFYTDGWWKDWNIYWSPYEQSFTLLEIFVFLSVFLEGEICGNDVIWEIDLPPTITYELIFKNNEVLRIIFFNNYAVDSVIIRALVKNCIKTVKVTVLPFLGGIDSPVQ